MTRLKQLIFNAWHLGRPKNQTGVLQIGGLTVFTTGFSDKVLFKMKESTLSIRHVNWHAGSHLHLHLGMGNFFLFLECGE